MLWFDMLAIPADAPHPVNAHKLIDFLLRPDVIARVTEATYLANANRGADAHPAGTAPGSVDLPRRGRARKAASGFTAYSAQYARTQSREFTRFKTAR